MHKILDKFYSVIGSFIKPIYVEGYLDDLLGQIVVIHLILFVLVICIFFLFIFFLINLMVILNKDKILKKFNNKYLILIIKYQMILAKFSLIYSPIFIIIGLFVLTHALYFLISHQIPYENLGLDLHTYITSPDWLKKK